MEMHTQIKGGGRLGLRAGGWVVGMAPAFPSLPVSLRCFVRCAASPELIQAASQPTPNPRTPL